MELPRFRARLLRWFSRAKRPMPWRQTRDPYAIWVSETMLQQTTVATVIPFYDRFLRRFPTVEALAASEEDAVLGLWSGLGYYSRARHLRLAARDIVENHEGRFPRGVETAMTLRGVGSYTASAVTSIAYGVRAAVLDGNVRRVLSRVHAKRGLTERESQTLASELLSPRSPGAWNEAMMELGATVCTPRAPKCDRCPVASDCLGRDRAEHWSEGKPRRASVKTNVAMALVERAGRILLTRNASGELMGGLYELPHSGLPQRSGSSSSLQDRYPGVLAVKSEVLATFRHAVTHHRIEATIHRATLTRNRLGPGLSFHTIDEALGLPLGGLTRKALRATGLIVGSNKGAP